MRTFGRQSRAYLRGGKFEGNAKRLNRDNLGGFLGGGFDYMLEFFKRKVLI